MILDRERLYRIMHDEVRKLIFEKEYDKVVLKRREGETELHAIPCAHEFTAHFGQMQDFIMTKWEPMEIPDTHIPALVVVPFSLVSMSEQMKRIELDGVHGISPLEASEIRDLEGTLDGPYLLIDVENGRERVNRATEATERLLKTNGRHALTVNEGIAFMTHVPEVLRSDYILELAGSRYREISATPEDIGERYTARPVAMLDGKTPRLSIYLPEAPDGFYDENWGVPSCALRIDPRMAQIKTSA